MCFVWYLEISLFVYLCAVLSLSFAKFDLIYKGLMAL